MGLWSDESAEIARDLEVVHPLGECYIEDTRVGVIWEVGGLIWVVDIDSIVKTI
jgi:hypothetical protein